MRILLIEDDAATSQSIELMLRAELMNVYSTDDADDGVDCAKNYDYDLILVDSDVLGVSGIEITRRIRAAKIATPIIALATPIVRQVSDTVAYLAKGADDYMTKPFHKDELVARIHAVARRARGLPDSVITFGDLVLDMNKKLVWMRESEARVYLTDKEYRMLELLMLRQTMTITKEMFLNHLYGGMDEPELKIIDVFICKIRRKISAVSGGDPYIETVWGRGYRLCDPEQFKLICKPGQHWQRSDRTHREERAASHA